MKCSALLSVGRLPANDSRIILCSRFVVVACAHNTSPREPSVANYTLYEMVHHQAACARGYGGGGGSSLIIMCAGYTGSTGTVKAELFSGVLFSVILVLTIFTEHKTHQKFRYYRYCIIIMYACSTSTLTWKTGFTENFPPPNCRFWRIPKILPHRKFLLLQYLGKLRQKVFFVL